MSLTSLCCKLQVHIITRNVMSHLDQYKILTDRQHGFRARLSCETQLLTLVHELAETVDSGGQMDLVILNFSKVFDRVPLGKDRLLWNSGSDTPVHQGLPGRPHSTSHRRWSNIGENSCHKRCPSRHRTWPTSLLVVHQRPA